MRETSWEQAVEEPTRSAQVRRPSSVRQHLRGGCGCRPPYSSLWFRAACGSGRAARCPQPASPHVTSVRACGTARRAPCAALTRTPWCQCSGAMSDRKAVVKNADMSGLSPCLALLSALLRVTQPVLIGRGLVKRLHQPREPCVLSVLFHVLVEEQASDMWQSQGAPQGRDAKSIPLQPPIRRSWTRKSAEDNGQWGKRGVAMLIL